MWRRQMDALAGYFEHVPAVWHKEIMWIMERGVHVFGSAGLGALRAVELETFGMRGVRYGRWPDDRTGTRLCPWS